MFEQHTPLWATFVRADGKPSDVYLIVGWDSQLHPLGVPIFPCRIGEVFNRTGQPRTITGTIVYWHDYEHAFDYAAGVA